MEIQNLPTRAADSSCFKLEWTDNLKDHNPELISGMQKVKNCLYSLAISPFGFLKYPVNLGITDCYRSKKELDCIQKGFNKVWHDDDIKVSSFAKRNYWKDQFHTPCSIKGLRKTFKPVDFTVTTPDDVTLRGTIFHKSSKPNAKTLLVCSGRSQTYQQGSLAWMLKLIKQKDLDVNLVMYNPRGYGFSSGEPSTDGFLIDGETMYQFIHQKLGVQEDNLYTYGFSLGGTTAARVKALHPDTKGKIIHERSFVDTNKQLHYLIADRIGDNIIASLISTILGWIFSLFGWQGSILEDWKSISSDKLIIAHKQDPFIPYKASLLNAVKDDIEGDSTTTAILLEAKKDRSHLVDHHYEDLSHYSDKGSNKGALSIVSNFLKN